jgi:hypothetical protein
MLCKDCFDCSEHRFHDFKEVKGAELDPQSCLRGFIKESMASVIAASRKAGLRQDCAPCTKTSSRHWSIRQKFQDNLCG